MTTTDVPEAVSEAYSVDDRVNALKTAVESLQRQTVVETEGIEDASNSRQFGDGVATAATVSNGSADRTNR